MKNILKNKKLLIGLGVAILLIIAIVVVVLVTKPKSENDEKERRWLSHRSQFFLGSFLHQCVDEHSGGYCTDCAFI